MTEYPEHEKLEALEDKNIVVGDFIEWLKEDHSIGRWHNNDFFPVRKSTADWLAEYFDIDQYKLEAEKRQMLDKIRESYAKKDSDS